MYMCVYTVYNATKLTNELIAKACLLNYQITWFQLNSYNVSLFDNKGIHFISCLRLSFHKFSSLTDSYLAIYFAIV